MKGQDQGERFNVENSCILINVLVNFFFCRHNLIGCGEAIFFFIQSVAKSFDAKVFLFSACPMKECFNHFSLSPISAPMFVCFFPSLLPHFKHRVWLKRRTDRLPLWLCASHVSLLGSLSLSILKIETELNYFTEVLRV